MVWFSPSKSHDGRTFLKYPLLCHHRWKKWRGPSVPICVKPAMMTEKVKLIKHCWESLKIRLRRPLSKWNLHASCTSVLTATLKLLHLLPNSAWGWAINIPEQQLCVGRSGLDLLPPCRFHSFICLLELTNSCYSSQWFFICMKNVCFLVLPIEAVFLCYLWSTIYVATWSLYLASYNSLLLR